MHPETTSMQFTARLLAFVLVIVAVSGAALAHPDVRPKSDKAIQGQWVVTGGEHGGNTMDSVIGGKLQVADGKFQIETIAGNRHQGRLLLDTSKRPHAIEFIHDNGMHWKGIYEVKGDVLRFNYVDAGGEDPIPDTFKTSAATEASLMILKRTQSGEGAAQ
jgi:uncharacterized protein (TIGR03067 family)